MHIATRRSEPLPGQIKVTLSGNMRIKLHSHKLLNGVTIAETVQAALEMYFQETYGGVADAAAFPAGE